MHTLAAVPRRRARRASAAHETQEQPRKCQRRWPQRKAAARTEASHVAQTHAPQRRAPSRSPELAYAPTRACTRAACRQHLCAELCCTRCRLDPAPCLCRGTLPHARTQASSRAAQERSWGGGACEAAEHSRTAAPRWRARRAVRKTQEHPRGCQRRCQRRTAAACTEASHAAQMTDAPQR